MSQKEVPSKWHCFETVIQVISLVIYTLITPLTLFFLFPSITCSTNWTLTVIISLLNETYCLANLMAHLPSSTCMELWNTIKNIKILIQNSNRCFNVLEPETRRGEFHILHLLYMEGRVAAGANVDAFFLVSSWFRGLSLEDALNLLCVGQSVPSSWCA